VVSRQSGTAEDVSTGSELPHDFDEMYLTSVPPWDIGRPQPVFVRLAESDLIRGRVLDVGCGTGEHVLMLAERGLDATGLDSAPAAIAAAQRKALQRGVAPHFLVFDALRLHELEDTFDTVIDCGLFHIFDDGDRRRFVDSLVAVVRSGGTYLMCCFSDRQPGDWGPRRVTQGEIQAAFANGWRVEHIDQAELEVNLDPPVVQAWLSTITRL